MTVKIYLIHFSLSPKENKILLLFVSPAQSSANLFFFFSSYLFGPARPDLWWLFHEPKYKIPHTSAKTIENQRESGTWTTQGFLNLIRQIAQHPHPANISKEFCLESEEWPEKHDGSRLGAITERNRAEFRKGWSLLWLLWNCWIISCNWKRFRELLPVMLTLEVESFLCNSKRKTAQKVKRSEPGWIIKIVDGCNLTESWLCRA